MSPGIAIGVYGGSKPKPSKYPNEIVLFVTFFGDLWLEALYGLATGLFEGGKLQGGCLVVGAGLAYPKIFIA